ncbi:hypothetical protein FVE85_0595 [Porphyridium purpureum]|uniref:DUF6816 domain-containing protein n=1 Tax=Porphyridium purpureum TaxID=35688 RepID=A0A5J4YZT0_PORPP|nr:hypothetical protein FVE85_0595 [Porphyridium purpureum]|eukprot:POR6053..scf208_2
MAFGVCVYMHACPEPAAERRGDTDRAPRCGSVDPAVLVTRRHVVRHVAAGGLAWLCVVPSERARADGAASTSSAGALDQSDPIKARIARMAETLPGYGPSDIYFPEVFLGVWTCSKTLVSVSGSDMKLVETERRRAETAPTRIFKVRFVQHRGHIVADRSFNACAEAEAEIGAAAEAARSESVARKSLQCMWQRDNPNVLTISTPGERRVSEFKVTKRSFKDQPAGPATFESSEYFRTTDAAQTDFLMGSPVLGAKRQLFKYKVTDESASTIAALEIENFYNPYSLDQKEPLLTCKYRITLKR